MITYRLGTFTRAVAFLVVITTAGIAAEPFRCAECGMPVDVIALFSSKIVAEDHTLYFCDIGDLLIYLRENKLGPAHAWVKDYRSGEWIEAVKAFYVYAPRRFTTPMGWGIASFKDRKTANTFGEAYNITTITGRLK